MISRCVLYIAAIRIELHVLGKGKKKCIHVYAFPFAAVQATSGALFFVATLPAFGAAGYVPTIFQERPLFYREQVRIGMMMVVVMVDNPLSLFFSKIESFLLESMQRYELDL